MKNTEPDTTIYFKCNLLAESLLAALYELGDIAKNPQFRDKAEHLQSNAQVIVNEIKQILRSPLIR